MFHETGQKDKLVALASEHAYNAVLITNADFSGGGPFIEYCNPAFCQMTGYSQAELVGRPPKILQGPETDPEVIDSLRQALKKQIFWEGCTTNYRKDGLAYVVNWNISPVFDEENALTHFISVQRDTTSQVAMEKERDILIKALNQANDPVFVTDGSKAIIFVNSAFERLTGYHKDEVLGQTPSFLYSGEQDEAFYRDMWETLEKNHPFQARFINRDKYGNHFHIEQSIAPVQDEQGRYTHFISTAWQVDQIVEREKILYAEATEDKLTGLLTRRAGDEALALAHHCYQAELSSLSVIICDIDYFKSVNDTYGHLAGDRIIKKAAETLKDQLRPSDPVVRWGGEEFLVVIDASMSTSFKLAERLRHAVSLLEDSEVGHVTLSLGIAEVLPSESIEQLLGRADEALYLAKNNGRNMTMLASGQ